MEKLAEKFNNKKSIENLVIFLILLIIVWVVIKNLTKPIETGANIDNYSLEHEGRPLNAQSSKNEKDLEEKLEEILSQISGAGKVDVMISYMNEIEKIPMTDTKVTKTLVSEKDSNGGERQTEETSTEENIIYEESNNIKTPVIKQSMSPEAIGVIVVAEGAYNETVKSNLKKAVEATVIVASERIQVFSK